LYGGDGGFFYKARLQDLRGGGIKPACRQAGIQVVKFTSLEPEPSNPFNGVRL
jgi:hypothetical protein